MSNFKQKLLDFKISKKLPYWCIAPIVILLTAIIVFATLSLKTGRAADGVGLGIDFTGGTEMTVQVEDTKENETKIKDIVEKNRENAPKIDYVQGVSTGGTDGIRIKYKNTIEDSEKMKLLNDDIRADIYAAYGIDINDTNTKYFATYTNTSKTASADLIKNALLATGIALLLILVYIIIRFEWLSGIAAVLALLHD